jgi:hypothetical protein
MTRVSPLPPLKDELTGEQSAFNVHRINISLMGDFNRRILYFIFCTIIKVTG